MDSGSTLSFLLHLQIFIRSLFIQTWWNYKTMISLGYCFTLLPIKKELAQERGSILEFIKENIKFFNAHPYFAGYMIGISYKIFKDEPENAYQKLDKIKNLITGPLGAIGDKLFWENIKPAMMLTAVVGGLLQLDGYPGWIVMVLAFIGYNIPHLHIRWKGIKIGYNEGVRIYNKLNFESFEKIYKLYMQIGKVMWLIGLTLTVITGIKYLGWLVVPIGIMNFGLTLVIYHYTNSVFRYLTFLLISNLLLTIILTG